MMMKIIIGATSMISISITTTNIMIYFSYWCSPTQTFKLPTRVAQLGLRLVSDSLALAALRSPESSGSVARRLPGAQ